MASNSIGTLSDLGSGSRLVIDLGAIRANYRRLQAKLGTVPCAGVVKADAYGLGADRVAPVLWEEGCRVFFTATLPEAVTLRAVLPEASICVLNGLMAETPAIFTEHAIVPCLNDLEQIARWRTHASRFDRPLPAILHVDTGMSRSGLDSREFDWLLETPSLLDGIDWLYVMSHLASADEPDSPQNPLQLDRFRGIRRALPVKMGASLANSAGILLSPDYHFDLGRPGIGLYGGRPRADRPNPHACPIRLEGQVLQVRTIPTGEAVSYGATWRAERETRVATVAAGYADGYLRSLSSNGRVALADREFPVLGRVTMDMIMIDVTDAPATAVHPGMFVELLGPTVHPDRMADAAGTIGYELLTGLGTRYARQYVDSDRTGS